MLASFKNNQIAKLKNKMGSLNLTTKKLTFTTQ